MNLRFCQKEFLNSLPSKSFLVTTVFTHFEIQSDKKCSEKFKGALYIQKWILKIVFCTWPRHHPARSVPSQWFCQRVGCWRTRKQFVDNQQKSSNFSLANHVCLLFASFLSFTSVYLSIYLGRFPQFGGSRQHKRNNKNTGDFTPFF